LASHLTMLVNETAFMTLCRDAKKEVWFTDYIVYYILQLKHVQEGTGICCYLCPRYWIECILYCMYFQNISNNQKFCFRAIVNWFELVLKKLMIEVHGSNVVHLKDSVRFRFLKIMQFGLVQKPCLCQLWIQGNTILHFTLFHIWTYINL
jgi:hypothetical protein